MKAVNHTKRVLGDIFTIAYGTLLLLPLFTVKKGLFWSLRNVKDPEMRLKVIESLVDGIIPATIEIKEGIKVSAKDLVSL